MKWESKFLSPSIPMDSHSGLIFSCTSWEIERRLRRTKYWKNQFQALHFNRFRSTLACMAAWLEPGQHLRWKLPSRGLVRPTTSRRALPDSRLAEARRPSAIVELLGSGVVHSICLPSCAPEGAYVHGVVGSPRPTVATGIEDRTHLYSSWRTVGGSGAGAFKASGHLGVR